MQTSLSNKQKNIRGATMIEYMLIVGLIAMVAVGGITLVGTNIGTLLDTISTTLSGI